MAPRACADLPIRGQVVMAWDSEETDCSRALKPKFRRSGRAGCGSAVNCEEGTLILDYRTIDVSPESSTAQGEIKPVVLSFVKSGECESTQDGQLVSWGANIKSSHVPHKPLWSPFISLVFGYLKLGINSPTTPLLGAQHSKLHSRWRKWSTHSTKPQRKRLTFSKRG